MEYKVIRALGQESFEDVVNKNIQKGWKPLGGARVLEASVSYEFFQTMIRSK